MNFKNVCVLLLVIGLGVVCDGQETVRRRKLRTRTQTDSPAEEESSGGRVRTLGTMRGRQRALQGLKSGGEPEESFSEAPRGRLRGVGGRGRRPAAGTRGQGRQRGTSSRRFPGRPRRPRPPVYYYDDYYYDPAYEEEYYDDYDYDYDVVPEKTQTGGKSSPLFSAAQTGQTSDLPDIGGEDYGGLIKELWRQFLEEKQKGSSRVVTQAPEEYECPPRSDVSYYLPSDDQCDKFLECNIKGELREHLCPDGFTFDITLEKCDYPVKVNCSTRPLLQEPQPSVNCTRANGFFPWPASISCQNFWDCREGKAYKQTCPVGVIFDPNKNTCATPDQSSRTECTEGTDSFFGFQCPQYTPDSVLKFGNHDRLADPDNCQAYYTCLRTGGPRLANCGRKKVFNNATGQCGNPKDVPGCETYWIEKLKEEGVDDEYYDYDD
eukprot:GFUD01011745.1.p1 GENE.GFUD01011745.1~~GFUD01011745.1.p1  ORF type:complete len:464 (+),score=98.25 GFUD01011745.1:88-1392(+)